MRRAARAGRIPTESSRMPMTDPLPATAPPPKKHGCFFYGCLTLIILALLGGTITFFVGRAMYRQFMAAVEQYTDTSPANLPKVEMSPSALDALQKRWAAFKEALDAGKPAEALTLTGDELNALIASTPELAPIKDRFRVTIVGDQVRGQVSLPLDEFGKLPLLSRLKGRYVNGAASFKADLENGFLVVTLQSLEVKGRKVPEEIMTSLRQQNLAKDVYQNPKNAEVVAKLESIKVDDGRVVVKARAKE